MKVHLVESISPFIDLKFVRHSEKFKFNRNLLVIQKMSSKPDSEFFFLICTLNFLICRINFEQDFQRQPLIKRSVFGENSGSVYYFFHLLMCDFKFLPYFNFNFCICNMQIIIMHENLSKNVSTKYLSVIIIIMYTDTLKNFKILVKILCVTIAILLQYFHRIALK